MLIKPWAAARAWLCNASCQRLLSLWTSLNLGKSFAVCVTGCQCTAAKRKRKANEHHRRSLCTQKELKVAATGHAAAQSEALRQRGLIAKLLMGCRVCACALVVDHHIPKFLIVCNSCVHFTFRYSKCDKCPDRCLGRWHVWCAVQCKYQLILFKVWLTTNSQNWMRPSPLSL